MLIKIWCWIFFLCLPLLLYSQEAVVAADNMQMVYAGLDNPLTIAVEETSCDLIVIETDNGIITRDSLCHYSWKPVRPGEASLALKKKKGNGFDELGNKSFRVKRIPDPLASLGGSGHAIHKFIRQKGLLVKMDGFDWDVHFEVVDFYLEITSKGKCIYAALNKGALYSPEAVAAIGKMYPGDLIKADRIRCVGPDKVIRTIAAVQLRLP